MKHKLKLLGEDILVNHVVYCSKVNQQSDKWFFNVVHISGVSISIVGDTEEEVKTARKRLLKAKIKNDKELLKKVKCT